nr:transglycosylase SLT domain-containing protein [Cytophagales bacterium]
MLRLFCTFCIYFTCFTSIAKADVIEFTSSGFTKTYLAKDYLSKSDTHHISLRPYKKQAKFNSYIEIASKKHDVSKALIEAVIQVESAYNPNATSPKGAMGLMQLMPATARELGVSDAYNAEENIEGGVKYLRYLLNAYEGETRLALAAYNAGEGAVNKYQGIPPYKETQNYVRKIEQLLDRSIQDQKE